VAYRHDHTEKKQSVVTALDAIKRWPSEEARKWAYEAIPILCKAEGTCAVVLFGSVARNIASAIDLDVLYVYEGAAPIPLAAPIDVDLRKFERQDVEQLLVNGNDLITWCIKFGRSLCEHDEYWSDLVSRWRNKVSLPSREVALERASKSEKLLRDVASLGDSDAALELYLSFLTHIARSVLIEHGVYPESRPELVSQLSQVGEERLASYLKEAIAERNAAVHGVRKPRKDIWRPFLDEWKAQAL
jgi:predicted nucleotidyltransferase